MEKRFLPYLLSFFLTITLLLFPAVSSAENVILWQNGQESVYAPLPESWEVLTREELSTFAEMNRTVLKIPGRFVSGFRKKGDKEVTASPFIVVFVNEEGRITREEMQKTYSWFKKNNELVSGLLPYQVKSVTIEDIEYFQEQFSIYFQVRVEMESKSWFALNRIYFLRKGYLNIVGFVPQNRFFAEQETLKAFSADIFIPLSLRYELPPEKKSRVESPFLVWLANNWQLIIGIFLLLGVYALVFLRGRRDFLKRGS